MSPHVPSLQSKKQEGGEDHLLPSTPLSPVSWHLDPSRVRGRREKKQKTGSCMCQDGTELPGLGEVQCQLFLLCLCGLLHGPLMAHLLPVPWICFGLSTQKTPSRMAMGWLSSLWDLPLRQGHTRTFLTPLLVGGEIHGRCWPYSPGPAPTSCTFSDQARLSCGLSATTGLTRPPRRSHSNRRLLGNGGQMGTGAPPPPEGREFASGTPSGRHMGSKMLLQFSQVTNNKFQNLNYE